MSIYDKLAKTGSLKSRNMTDAYALSDSDKIVTDIPAMNIGMTGEVDGGMYPGIFAIAGPSKHYKTLFALEFVRAFLDKDEENICIFYDTEYGSPMSYLTSKGIDPERIIYCEPQHVEDLKFDCVAKLEQIVKDKSMHGKVMIFIDSIGNIASKKEIEDAISEKAVADMSRAKAIKSFSRIVAGYLKKSRSYMIAINHTYKTQELYSKDVMSGGTGLYYNADYIWIVGRRQTKDGDKHTGYEFVINIEKSRFVKEKSKIDIEVSYEHGINRWSGIAEMAKDYGVIKQVNRGKLGAHYVRSWIKDDEGVPKKDVGDDFYQELFDNTNINELIEEHYRLV